MLRRSEHRVPTKRGHVGVYLGDCTVDDVLIARDRFGAVTLQGRHGLDLVRTLRHMGRSIDGLDVDPAVYRKTPEPLADDGLFDLEVDWVDEQRRLGLTTIRTAAHRIGAGRPDELRRALEIDVPADVSVSLPLEGRWLGKGHLAELEQQLKAAHRDVTLVFGAVSDPIDSVDKVMALRRLVTWAAAERLRFEVLRTDLVGLPAVLDGLAYAAAGLTPSTRHFGIPIKNRRKDRVRRQQYSPLVFVPQLMHWLRAERIGVLGHWDGAGVTDCDCDICATEGSLLRFDEWFDSETESKAVVAAHNRAAMSRIVGAVLASDDPTAELRRRRDEAIHLVREIRSRQRIAIPLPAWIESWN